MKKFGLFFLLLALISCSSEQEAVVVSHTYLYKNPQPSNKSYYTTLKRGQIVYLKDDKTTGEHRGIQMTLVKCRIPNSNDEYWVSVKDVFKSGYESIRIYRAKHKILHVLKDTYSYKLPDEKSYKSKIKKGIRIIALEDTGDWYKIHHSGNIKWIKKSKVTDKQIDYIFDVNHEQLGQISIEASSHRINSIGTERFYSADLLMDGKIKNPWVSGEKNKKSGEWIVISLKDGAKKFELSIINGYAYNEKYYNNYSRAKKIKIEADGKIKTFNLKDDVMDYQKIGVFNSNKLKIYIDEIYSGENISRLAIGEIKMELIGN